MIPLTEQNFESEVLQSPIAVLVHFYATWCPPCRDLAPTLEELAVDMIGAAKVCKVNVDENQRLAEVYRIETLPTLIVFKGGQIVETFQGIQAKWRMAAALV